MSRLSTAVKSDRARMRARLKAVDVSQLRQAARDAAEERQRVRERLSSTHDVDDAMVEAVRQTLLAALDADEEDACPTCPGTGGKHKLSCPTGGARLALPASTSADGTMRVHLPGETGQTARVEALERCVERARRLANSVRRGPLGAVELEAFENAIRALDADEEGVAEADGARGKVR